jgi:hypothetical protein
VTGKADAFSVRVFPVGRVTRPECDWLTLGSCAADDSILAVRRFMTLRPFIALITCVIAQASPCMFATSSDADCSQTACMTMR